MYITEHHKGVLQCLCLYLGTTGNGKAEIHHCNMISWKLTNMVMHLLHFNHMNMTHQIRFHTLFLSILINANLKMAFGFKYIPPN